MKRLHEFAQRTRLNSMRSCQEKYSWIC